MPVLAPHLAHIRNALRAFESMLGFLTVAALGGDIDAKGFKPLRALFLCFFILCNIFASLFIYMAKIGGFLLLWGTIKMLNVYFNVEC